MDKPADQHCLNCKYSFLLRKDTQNLREPRIHACRRFPPHATRLIKGDQMMDISLWPVVSDATWCHEFAVELKKLA